MLLQLSSVGSDFFPNVNKPFPLFKWNESKHLWSQAWRSYKNNLRIYASNKNWLLGLRPRPRWGSLQHSPIPPSWAAGGHPSRTFPRRVFLNFIQILHLAVCTLPYIHVHILSWLRHCMVESTYNMLCTPNTQPGYGPALIRWQYTVHLCMQYALAKKPFHSPPAPQMFCVSV